eukprot:1673950-Pleurochrysis_carterae.AAC.2
MQLPLLARDTAERQRQSFNLPAFLLVESLLLLDIALEYLAPSGKAPVVSSVMHPACAAGEAWEEAEEELSCTRHHQFWGGPRDAWLLLVSPLRCRIDCLHISIE